MERAYAAQAEQEALPEAVQVSQRGSQATHEDPSESQYSPGSHEAGLPLTKLVFSILTTRGSSQALESKRQLVQFELLHGALHSLSDVELPQREVELLVSAVFHHHRLIARSLDL